MGPDSGFRVCAAHCGLLTACGSEKPGHRSRGVDSSSLDPIGYKVLHQAAALDIGACLLAGSSLGAVAQ
jgi:hypothetical protein